MANYDTGAPGVLQFINNQWKLTSASTQPALVTNDQVTVAPSTGTNFQVLGTGIQVPTPGTWTPLVPGPGYCATLPPTGPEDTPQDYTFVISTGEPNLHNVQNDDIPLKIKIKVTRGVEC